MTTLMDTGMPRQRLGLRVLATETKAKTKMFSVEAEARPRLLKFLPMRDRAEALLRLDTEASRPRPHPCRTVTDCSTDLGIHPNIRVKIYTEITNSYRCGAEILTDSERQGRELILSPGCRTPQQLSVGGVLKTFE